MLQLVHDEQHRHDQHGDQPQPDPGSLDYAAMNDIAAQTRMPVLGPPMSDQEARQIIEGFLNRRSQGIIPNRFPETGEAPGTARAIFRFRLHLLGDFWSVEYVRLWLRLLDMFPNLFVFGYTHRKPRKNGGDRIGDVLAQARRTHWARFADCIPRHQARACETTRSASPLA